MDTYYLSTKKQRPLIHWFTRRRPNRHPQKRRSDPDRHTRSENSGRAFRAGDKIKTSRVSENRSHHSRPVHAPI